LFGVSHLLVLARLRPRPPRHLHIRELYRPERDKLKWCNKYFRYELADADTWP